jgi:hypothetical protein
MANSLASVESSSKFQSIVEFLQDIDESVELLKSKINFISSKYPVTAQEKRLNQLIGKIQRDIQERLHIEKLSRETPPSLEETPTPSSSSEESIPIPSPPQEVTYPVVLYNNSCLRRRTVDQVGKLGQTLPRKKKVKVIGINVETLTNDRYDPGKRASEWSKELASLQQDTALSTVSENGEYKTNSWDTIRRALSNAQVLILDIGKTNFKNKTMPFFFFTESRIRDVIITRERVSLTSKEYTQLRGCDPNERLEIAMKIAAANYEYWSSVYYRGLGNKEKDPMQQALIKEYLRNYIKDPLNSKGLILYYQVQKTSHNQQLQCQAYIGKCEGSLVERLRQIHEDDNEDRSLLKLALRSKLLYSEKNEVGDNVEKNIALILDFGYTEEFVEKYKDRLDKGDRISVLQKSYIEYFGTRSPIGLN